MADEEKQEKKEGKISGFFKKVSKKLDDATFEMRLQTKYNEDHVKYSVHSGPSAFSNSPEIAAEEHLDEGYLITIDDDEIKAGSLIKRMESGEVWHISAVEEIKCEVEFDGKTVEHDAMKITLGERAQKVEVIKVENEFYLK